MKKCIILLIGALLITACALPDEPVVVAGNAKPPTNYSSVAPSVEVSVKIKPIVEYNIYFVQDNGSVFGIAGEEITPVSFEDSEGNSITPDCFGVIGGEIMMSFLTGEGEEQTTEYFTQKDGLVTEVDSIPVFADPEPVELDSEPFKIENSTSGDIEISKVYQGDAFVSYLPVNGAERVHTALWYHVSETYSIREAGLYIWPVDGNPRRIADKGRLW